MTLAPIGAFGAMAYMIGAYGIASLWPLGKLVAGFYGTCLIFVAVVLGPLSHLAGFSIWALIAYIKEELLIVLGTSSSESVLPRIMAKLEQLGCEKSIVGLVIPTGYSFNLDGTCVYLVTATVFLAQATNTALSVTAQLGIVAVLLLTSKGAAGVAGRGVRRAGLDARVDRHDPRGQPRAHPRHSPVHGGSDGDDQPGRQQRRHDRGRQVGRGARPGASPTRARRRARGAGP